MQKCLLSGIFLLMGSYLLAQARLQVVNDSVRITDGELIIRNSTRDVPGLLYNTGNGLTQFKPGWMVGGNTSVGLTGYFGTRDNSSIRIVTNNVLRGKWDSLGNLLIGNAPDRAIAPNQIPGKVVIFDSTAGGIVVAGGWTNSGANGYNAVRMYYNSTNGPAVSVVKQGDPLTLIGTNGAGGQVNIKIGSGSYGGTNGGSGIEFNTSNINSGGFASAFRIYGTGNTVAGATNSYVLVAPTLNSGNTDVVEGLRISPFYSGGRNLLFNFGWNSAANGAGTHKGTVVADRIGRTALGSDKIDSAAILSMNTTTAGFLPPRLTTAQRDALGANELQRVTLNGFDGGTADAFKITYGGNESTLIGFGGAAYTAANIKIAIEAITGLPGRQR